MILSLNQKSILTKSLVDILYYKSRSYINEEQRQVCNQLLEKFDSKDFLLDKEESIVLAYVIKRFNEEFDKNFPFEYASDWLNISDEILQELENKDCLLDVLYNINLDYIKDIYSCKIEDRARDVIKFISKLKESDVFINKSLNDISLNDIKEIGFLYNNCEWTVFPLHLDIDISYLRIVDAEYFENYNNVNFNKISKNELLKIISNYNPQVCKFSEITSQNIRFFKELLKPIEQ